MRKIWFVSHYSMPPQYEMRVKTQMYASLLQRKGYEVTIFAASTIHNTDINLIESKEKYITRKYDDLNYVFIKCHSYKGNGIKRIRNMLEFERKFYRYASSFKKPDVIIADVNCVNYYWIYRYCKKNGILFFVDMRDLWPLSIVEYANYSSKNPIIKYLYYREKIMYSRTNGTIFSMEGAKEYISDKKWQEFLPSFKIHYINNGVDISNYEKLIDSYSFSDSDLDSTFFKVVYAGSIREANNIQAIYETAKLFYLGGMSSVLFLLYGDGPDRIKYEELANKEGISNIVFKGQIEKKYIPFVLSKSNVTILNYKNSSTLKYGGSQNKLFEYMAAKKPVIVTMKMNYNEVERNNCGVCLDEPKPQLIFEAINKIKNLSVTEYNEMCNRSYECAKKYDFNILTNKLEEIINGVSYEN